MRMQSYPPIWGGKKGEFRDWTRVTYGCYLACLSVLSEHVASQSKWQSADLDLLKLAKKRKIVWTALFLGKVCIWSDKISTVSAILGRKSTARLKVNENTRSPPLSENLKFRKRMGFSVLGSLITVPLHSTLAVNNLGLKFVS